MTREPMDGLTIKAALFIGFGLTLGVWLVAGYQLTRRVGEVERQAAGINARYMHAQELLSTVRSQILVGSLYVRDGLLDPDADSTDAYRRQLKSTYHEVDQALEQYVPVLDSPTEQARVARLRFETADFLSTMLDVLNSDRKRWPTEARLLLNSRVVPKREGVLRVSEEVQALNRAAFVQQQTDISVIYATLQRRLWQQLGLALAGSLAIALLATVYAGRLENRLRRQQTIDSQNNNDLQRLSAKLITAQEEERRSIARELHDEVGQVLTALKVELAFAQRAIEAGNDSTRALADVRSITEGAINTVRDLSHLLHPALLDDLGLPAAVDWYLRGFGKRHGIRVDLFHDRMDERYTPETEAAAYRIVQEALTNVAKHAQATSCRVYLQRLPNTILITIEDDGRGIEPEVNPANPARSRRGLGLISIRERASELRGTVRLEGAPGKGTSLTVELPAHVRAPSAPQNSTADDPPAIRAERQARHG